MGKRRVGKESEQGRFNVSDGSSLRPPVEPCQAYHCNVGFWGWLRAPCRTAWSM
jgi:hypothetical protein